MEFVKYEAAGNDFIVVDGRFEDLLPVCRKNAEKWCDRHFGIGADGILLLAAGCGDSHAFMHVINSDGSIAAMCGNGIRCVARYLYEKGVQNIEHPLKIDTLGGLQRVSLVRRVGDDWLLDVVIARSILGNNCELEQNGRIWSGRCVDVGNPHAVFEVDESPREAMICAGRYLSEHPYFPDRCNIEFIREISSGVIDFCVYERGAGPTLACGTGCVAAATAYADAHGMCGKTIEIHAPGGILFVKTAENAGESAHLQGPATRVFEGKI